MAQFPANGVTVGTAGALPPAAERHLRDGEEVISPALLPIVRQIPTEGKNGGKT